MRNGAFLLMMLAVFIVLGPEVVRIFEVTENYSFAIDQALKRGGISLLIFAPAFYLARESSNHRKVGVRNRRTELTLRTLDPYLSLIKEENDRDEIKKKIAESIFSEAPIQESQEDTSQAIAQLNKLFSNISKTVSRK